MVSVRPASKQVLLDEVHHMGIEKPTPEEIELAKSYLKGMHIMSQESNSGQAIQYGHYELLGIGYEFVNIYNEKVDSVSAEDILRVGEQYLTDKYALGCVMAK